MVADNRDVSKTLSLPFDKSTYILKIECIKSVEKAKVFDQLVEFEHFPKPPKGAKKIFRLEPSGH